MRFNRSKNKKTEIRNHEAGIAFGMSAELELYTSVVTASLSNTFYEKESERLDRIKRLLPKVSHEFIAKLAVYAREKMYLRSIPLILINELAKLHNGDDLVKRASSRVIMRADEITEMLACYQYSNKRNSQKKLNKLSKQLQKGIAEAFNKFDEYQFAKYNRNTEVSMKDALFLVHPRAKDANQQEVFNKIVNDSLRTPYTWEVELSVLGQKKFGSETEKQLAKRAKWEELIESRKLGYMALLRNLRNIITSEISFQHIRMVGNMLSDEIAVRKSKQLPFRFLAAYREVEKMESSLAPFILDSLEKAVKFSIENLKGFELDTKVLLAADVSASMFQNVSRNSTIRLYDIGLLLSMLMRYKTKNVITGIFGDTWKAVNLPKDNILANTQKLNKIEGSVGYSTNGHLVIKTLIEKRIKMDKVMFFTDMQIWDSSGRDDSLSYQWNVYKKRIAPNAKLYVFDLAGYGQSPIKTTENDVFLIAGWSDKIFDVLAAVENGSNALTEIMNVQL